MMVVETQKFDFENGCSVQPNDTCMFCGCFWTKAPTCFVTVEFHFLHCHNFILSHLMPS